MFLEDFAIIPNKLDNVAIAKKDTNTKKLGDRFAINDIRQGDYLYQYGYPFAKSLGIKKGELISLKNTSNDIPSSKNKTFVEPDITQMIEKYQNKTFLGYKRENGAVGTRNYIAIIPTSMCASEVSNQVASHFDNKEFSENYKNIDGVVSLAHTEGCGCGAGLQIDRTMEVLKGFALHPNVHSVLFIDLGCEQTSYEVMSQYINKNIANNKKAIQWITIQENGGIEETINKSINIVKSFLVDANSCTREKSPISNLILGTECGGSDRFSGITANPLIGKISDKIIYGGGKAILSEVPEMLGVYDMFFKRFASLEVAEKFQKSVNWYIDIANRLNINISNNVVPANVKGGLINSYIKSLGAVMKGGETRIEDILEYAEPIKKDGLSIMQGPGNDLESLTGLVATGANMICFSTGYGTITGNAITPVIKISSNSETYNKLKKDMDFNAGKILDGEDMEKVSEELLEKVIAVASGEKSWSENWKQRQFQIWTAGKLTL
jgi:altronate hydrolase